MCGIAGCVDFHADLTRDRTLIAAMTQTMSCRGPDAEGIWVDTHAALGHRRLAIIDLAGGVQPMVAREGGETIAVLSYSGEVYNFTDLRAELVAAGHQFRTSSDTEVVLEAYREWGVDFARRLEGMFAFAIWDVRRRELVLVRDRMGVKPLFWSRTPHGALFGSEPKAILAHPGVSRRVGADGLCEVFDMVKTPGMSVFTDLREVRPGTIVRVSELGVQELRYWRLEAREHTDDLPTTIATVRELLAGAVTRQLVSDVPVCTLLSGGLDSSAVTALAARSGVPGLRSFSVDFADTGQDFEPDAVRGAADAPFVADLVRHVGIEHHDVLLDSRELTDPAIRAAVLRAVDSPPAYWGDMWPSLYLLFRAVRRHATVAVSGEAADELFGGYPWFRNPAALEIDSFPWLTPGSARYFGGLTYLDKGLLQKLDLPGYRAERYAEAKAEMPVLAGESPQERQFRRVTYMNLTRFVQTLLDRKDRMSMAVGLEARVPFCDHHLVEYVFNTPAAMKCFDGREKSLLRAAVADLLPQSIVERRKTPYPAVQDPGYELALRAELATVLADRNSPVLALVDVEKLSRVPARPIAAVSRSYDRGGLEMVLWLNRWLTEYDVVLDI